MSKYIEDLHKEILDMLSTEEKEAFDNNSELRQTLSAMTELPIWRIKYWELDGWTGPIACLFYKTISDAICDSSETFIDMLMRQRNNWRLGNNLTAKVLDKYLNIYLTKHADYSQQR